ncbi:MAG: RT0821/Lpp0805 family surface protein [Beijerinckiaceae bacterium]
MPFEGRQASSVASDDDITTASIPSTKKPFSTMEPGQVSPLSAKLDEEDWRRARASLSTALDPQGNGSVVRWENTDSGAKGSFGPVGNAYLVKDEICRVFVATLSAKAPEELFQGNACRVSHSEWQIRELKPWKKS